MSATQSTGPEKAAPAGGWRHPHVVAALAWFLPGCGHLVMGRMLRAGVFAAVVIAAFVTGVALDGELATPTRGQPLTWLAFFARVGNGALFVAAKLADLGRGDVSAGSFAFGNTFIYTAGLMNLLAMLDAGDIARGTKD